ncbi:MAG: hypothetical protein WA960_20725 [Tunicatimonas sp.]
MKNVSFFLLLFLAISACENCDPDKAVGPTCSVENPVEELAWLQDEIQSRGQIRSSYEQYFYISQAKYKGETVFIYDGCCPNCNTIVRVFNCSGEQIGLISPSAEDIDRNLLTEVSVLWQPENFACNF